MTATDWRENEKWTARGGTMCLVALNENWLSWATPMKHDALTGRKARTIASGNVVLTLAALKLDNWHHMLVSERSDCLAEAVVEWADGGRRGDSIAEVIAQKGVQLAAVWSLGTYPLRYRRSMHEVDNETWSRNIVATLGLGIVGCLPRGQG